jgi:large subunit ribosomal protein L18
MRVRKRIHGTAARPRLSVFRSAAHIYAQLVDDDRGLTLAAVSTRSAAFKEKTAAGGKAGNKEAAGIVGTLIAEMAKAKGVAAVVFDRNRYRYHGRVKALADGARAGGLTF